MNVSVFCKRAGILAVCLLSGALLFVSACDQLLDDGSLEDGVSSSKEPTEICDYILVRGDNSGNEVLRQVLHLKNAIDDRFHTDTLSSTDWAVDAAEDGKGRREILVGHTNREESIAANEELKGVHGYVIRSSGDKIVITASTTGLLKEAVTYFTEEYVNDPKAGDIPAEIDVFHRAELPLGVMSEGSSMRLFVSEKASAILSAAVSNFADRIKDLSGVRPEIVKDAVLNEETVVISFKNTLFGGSTENPRGLPEATPAESWSMFRENDKVTLQGQTDRQTAAALADLYEQLVECIDRTLEGQAVFYYERQGVYRESWGCASVRLTGARYLGTESVAGNSRCSYYEGVSLNAYCGWKMVMADENGRAFELVKDATFSAVFRSADGKIEVSAYYNSDDRTLTVIEKS